MVYVDGYVIPLPKRNVPLYRRIAQKAGRIWREHGALEYRECVGDDMKAKGLLPFPKLARLKPGETVAFSWIVYRTKAHRNSVNAKVMKDPRLHDMMKQAKKMPFDMKRMAFGGFKVIVDL
jgi:uncharacterized protein YbaA (DUF1428 family)